MLRLRRIFAKYGIADNAIEAVPGGYRIPADPATLDLLAFRGLLASAAARTADPESELATLQQGWRCGRGRSWPTCPRTRCTATKCRG
ncbi:hypothetical protein NKH77_02690 [Streptomyces sp. M19]